MSIPVRLAAALAFAVLPWTAGAQEIDPAWSLQIDDTVRAIATQANGGVVVGGDFGNVAGQPRAHLARLAANGALDAGFTAQPDDDVLAIRVQADGRIVVAGRFESVSGASHAHVVRLLPDGSIDPTFQSGIATGAASEVSGLGVLADGRVVVAGRFDEVSGQPRERIARLASDGTLDPSFVPPPAESPIDAIFALPSGKVLVAGGFEELVGCTSGCVHRLNANGSLDGSFTATEVLGSVATIAPDASGRILIGGNFGEVDGNFAPFVARLQANGGADTSFGDAGLRYSHIKQVLPQSDGGLLIGGEMRWGTAGASVDRVARLSASGARDTDFDEPQFDSMVLALAAHGPAGVLVGGMFTQAGGITRVRIARIVLDELPDPVFHNGFD